MASNQDKLNDLHWLLCEDDGRELLFKWMRDSARTVALEPGVLDAQALAILKRECDLIDPTAKTQNVVAQKTTLASRVKWTPYNFEQARQDAARTRERVEAVEDKLDQILALLTPASEEVK